MSNAAVLPQQSAAARAHLRAVPSIAEQEAAQAASSSSALPAGTAPRGFALYVGLDEVKAAIDGVGLPVLVDALRRTIADLAPSADTYAAVALAPEQAGGRDVDVVRLALKEPGAVRRREQEAQKTRTEEGVVIDLSRKRVVIDGEHANLTYKEFELLQYLVLREGSTIERSELVESLWQAGDDDAPGVRTIDVHVRRLRSKLDRYQDIVRTVRGAGYRFDRHADVAVRYGAGTPSPDAV
ncbi:winged helix-turn-helix domain-containing protein [Microbacterium halophytorum]|uniref:winged helix-turn-helix domain-containing protein n=1 Tax=Microbacterium halophytorum TaxID=2067568 RepID=UPI000CFB28D5|nr:winged helix-turn-helix domain-containing protein [Microbacterium halophytorum]